MNIRRHFTTLAAGAAAGLSLPAVAQSNAPFNVLFIIADDLKPTLGCYGDRLAITPNIDRLAASGIVFTSAYCTYPLCSASRASMMTSLMPEENSVFSFTPLRAALPDLITLPQHFKNNGYDTVAVGKVHDHRTVGDIVAPDQSTINGIEKEDVLSWTLPFNWGGGKTGSTQFPDRDGRKWPLAAEAKVAVEKNFTDPIRCQLMLTNLTPLAAQYRNTGKPFFAAVGFARPHLPFLAPPAYWNLYNRNDFTPAAFQEHPTNSTGWAWDTVHELQNYYILNVDIEGFAVPFPWNGYGEPLPPPLSEENQKELLHGYYACVSFVDTQVGRLLDKLQAEGIASNTIVVFLGDHGFHLGDHNKWGKQTPMEQDAWAPLIISAPGCARKGTVSGSRVSFLDIYPTLCELAGLQQPVHPVPEAVRSNYNGATELPLRGRSLVPILNNPETEIRNGAVCCYREAPFGYSYRTDRYRYIEWIQSDGSVRARELFDYETDPNETVNIAGGNELLTFKLAEQMRNPAESPGCPLLQGSQPTALSPGVWYAGWAAQYGLSGTNALYTADPDGDGIPNLLEHAAGGNPNSAGDSQQIFRLSQTNVQTNGFEFTYRRQRYAAGKGLVYRLEGSTNLVSDTWDTLEFVETRTAVIDQDFETVTARIPAATNNQEFIRLKIEITP
jgi:arylsulfatase A-like enzyme